MRGREKKGEKRKMMRSKGGIRKGKEDGEQIRREIRGG